MKKTISILLLILIKSTSIGYCMTPIMGRTSEDTRHYGENAEFEATIPFLLIGSDGEAMSLCSGSFVDVDGDLFFVTAGHCVNGKEIEGVEPTSVKRSNEISREIDSESMFFRSSLRAQDFTFEHAEVLKARTVLKTKYDVVKAINRDINELEDDDQNNPLKVISIVMNNVNNGIAPGLPGTDLAFLSMNGSDVPFSIKPLKLYKGTTHKLMDQKVTVVGFGVDLSWPSFTDLVKSLGCSITGYYCEEGFPRQAGDLRIYGKMDKQNMFMLYPSESKDDVAAYIEQGDSGGAVLYKDEKEGLVIIGVNSGQFDLKDFKENLSQYYGNFEKAVDELEIRGARKISGVQFIEPGKLERERFLKCGWGKAIRAKNEGILFKAIEEGVLGVNHDSRGLLLRTAIENELWELAMELVHRGISGVENFGVLYSLADKGAWEIFDTVMEIIKSKADKDKNWIKDMTDITLGLNQYEEERITRYFGLLFLALEKKDREEITKKLDRIKEVNKGLGNF